MRATGTILVGAALLALAACGGGTTTATNNAVANDVYVVPDDLGANDLLLNESDLNEAVGAPADNAATTNASGNSL